jgi:hypothetical protein
MVDGERPAIELLFADEVGDGLTLEAAVEEDLEARGVEVGDLELGAGEQGRLVRTEDVGEEEQGFARRGVERDTCKTMPRAGE